MPPKNNRSKRTRRASLLATPPVVLGLEVIGLEVVGPPEHTEDWKSISGEYVCKCELFTSTDDELLCGIMQEPTHTVEIQDLPQTWSVAPGLASNCAKTQCGHVFHPTALALHFLVSDMRCPVCRVGSTEKMDIQSIAEPMRELFHKKALEVEKADQVSDNELLQVSPQNIHQVLSDLELHVTIFAASGLPTARNTNVHTRVIFENSHVHEILQSMSQEASEENQWPHSTAFAVHRSFQRLLRVMISKQYSSSPDSRLQFSLRHALVPVNIESAEMSIAEAWDNIFNNTETSAIRNIDLSCLAVAGLQPVARVLFTYDDQSPVPAIGIHVNMHMLLNITSYVGQVLDSIQQAVNSHISSFDTDNTVEITHNAINGIIMHVL